MQLAERHLSGFQLKPVEVTATRQFDELYPHRKLPVFYWLDVFGRAGKDDFGVVPDDGRLVVSKEALAIIEPLCPAACDISKHSH
jgi:hypothetical protein